MRSLLLKGAKKLALVPQFATRVKISSQGRGSDRRALSKATVRVGHCSEEPGIVSGQTRGGFAACSSAAIARLLTGSATATGRSAKRRSPPPVEPGASNSSRHWRGLNNFVAACVAAFIRTPGIWKLSPQPRSENAGNRQTSLAAVASSRTLTRCGYVFFENALTSPRPSQ